ncbi:hypothetical protein IHE45_10G043300 [Dioscorea alata]|uniref:Uncharacterized protein n=1 Tax=Dioscorea alata TaxID=55571 RepID=A0ACB7VAH9_DIOAL|nr:hypothetical protein IHE45_10G043300 [Dioscorea alata]
MDFSFWKMHIEDYPYSKKLHLPLGTKPETMKEEAWNLFDRQKCYKSYLKIHNVTITSGTMKVLFDMYKKPYVNNKIHVVKKLFKHEDDKSS